LNRLCSRHIVNPWIAIADPRGAIMINRNAIAAAAAMLIPGSLYGIGR
jgi:hypothetical protein